MIIFENEGEIDPRLIMLIGVNVKETDSAIGFFGTGLKYGIACLARWGEFMTIQSGAAEFTFSVENTKIRGLDFGIINMCSRFDRAALGFTTELGKQWEPWMVYRELWCNAHDEPAPKIYETDDMPLPIDGLTRVIVSGEKIEAAHVSRNEFILDKARKPLHIVKGLEIYEGAGERIFYRGIAVQQPDKPSLYTYNITERIWLTEDRTAGSWTTDPIIARGLTKIDAKDVIDATISAPAERLESRLDYSYASDPGDAWTERAHRALAINSHAVPSSVRAKFATRVAATCPTCGRAMSEALTADAPDDMPF